MEAFLHRLFAIGSSERVFPIGTISGLCESVLLLLPVYLLGVQDLGSLSVWVNLFIIFTSFTSGFLLVAPAKAVKALLISVAIVLSLSGVALASYPPAVNINFFPYFLFVGSFKVFSLGIIGSIVGSFLASWLDEMLRPKSIYYSVILFAGIAAATVSFLLSLVIP